MVLVIAGSTGVGKSDVAALLCRWHDGMVVSADSVQAYEGVDIGANKPTAEERRETPHLLVDVASSRSPYNAADWRRDALRAIRSLLQPARDDDARNGTSEISTNDAAGTHSNIELAIREGRSVKGYAENQPLLPVVVGGTMMYLQWLVHGMPDAAKPSPTAAERAATVMNDFEASEDWTGAVACLMQEASDPRQTSILQQQVDKLSGRDWYRLRRILEVAYTIKESQQLESDTKDTDDPWERLYSGERTGGLTDLGYDVRCFFLCPSDRMNHTRVVDERCEDMIRRGLLKETAHLAGSGQLPDMVTKAIGYRQALEYLSRRDASDGDEPSFHDFMDAFTTATRRYARKQMLWFRKDLAFVFVPVDVVKPKSDRVLEAAIEIDRMIRMPRDEFDFERTSNESISEQTRRSTELQAKKMKTYQFQRYVLRAGSDELASALAEADECTRRFQSAMPHDRLQQRLEEF